MTERRPISERGRACYAAEKNHSTSGPGCRRAQGRARPEDEETRRESRYRPPEPHGLRPWWLERSVLLWQRDTELAQLRFRVRGRLQAVWHRTVPIEERPQYGEYESDRGRTKRECDPYRW
jgi:hypothetical protein